MSDKFLPVLSVSLLSVVAAIFGSRQIGEYMLMFSLLGCVCASIVSGFAYRRNNGKIEQAFQIVAICFAVAFLVCIQTYSWTYAFGHSATYLAMLPRFFVLMGSFLCAYMTLQLMAVELPDAFELLFEELFYSRTYRQQ